MSQIQVAYLKKNSPGEKGIVYNFYIFYTKYVTATHHAAWFEPVLQTFSRTVQSGLPSIKPTNASFVQQMQPG